MRNRCQNPCIGACEHIPGTRCHVVRRIAVCSRIQTRCPTDYYGRDCQSIYPKDSDNIPKEGHQRDTEDVPDSGSSSPCSPSPCGSNAECLTKDFQNTELNVTSQIAFCQCVPNYTGNADIECYPIEEQLLPDEKPDLIDLARDTNSNATQATETSTAPSTTCSAASDCLNGTCVEGRCVPDRPVEAKTCGINAISIISNGVASCSCPEGYTGISTIECHEIASKKQ